MREYARALGAVLVLIGVVGLVLGERLMPNVLNLVVSKDLAHLLTGGLLAFVGFSRTGEELARTAVAALGTIYLLVGVLGLLLPALLGPLLNGYSLGEDVIHLVIGVLSLTVAFVSGHGGAARA